MCLYHRRMRRGGGRGGSCPPPPKKKIRANSGGNSGKQWGKFGQSKKKKSARESYKLTPLECGWWRHTGCECPRVGVFFKFWEGGWRHAGNVQGGGGACGYLCKISGKSTPLPPPLTKAFPYAYGLYTTRHERSQSGWKILSQCHKLGIGLYYYYNPN